MANEQHKWTFPKFWKSSKRDTTAVEGGDAHNHGSGSTTTSQERQKFQLRKSSSQSSVFQTRRNSRPSAERVTDDMVCDPEWVPFHRSLSPGLKSKDNTSTAASPLKMGNNQGLLDNGKTCDQWNSPVKLGSPESKGMPTALGLTSDIQRSYLAGQNNSPRDPTSVGWKQRERVDADTCESGGHRLCHNVGSPTMSPTTGDDTFKNAHHGTVSRRLFPASGGQRRERPHSENVVALSPVRDYSGEFNDGQSGVAQQRRDEGVDAAWGMHRQAITDSAVCRTGTEGGGSHLQKKRDNDDLVQTGGNDRQLFARKVGGEANKEQCRTVDGPTQDTNHREVKQTIIGHCPPQQDRVEKINYVQVDHTNPQSGQHLDRSNKLALIGQCHKGDLATGNEECWLPEQACQGFMVAMSSAGIPGVVTRNVDSSQNDDVQIGSIHAVTDFRSSGPARCFPEGAECPIPCQMAKVAAPGDVRGDYDVGIVHVNSAAGSYQEADAQTMDVCGSRRARQPWERNMIPRSMVAGSPDRGMPYTQQRYQESLQMRGNYQGAFPQQRSVCFDDGKQFHGMTSSTPAVPFNKGPPAAEQHTRAAPSYRWLIQNEATPDRYDEKIPMEAGIGFANVQRRITPGFSQATVGNKSHVPLKQLWNKPLDVCSPAICRSPQDPCTVSTTSQDSGFEQRLQHNLDSQNQSQMSSILESSINTPPIFVSGDSGDVKEYYGNRQRRPVETSRRQTMQASYHPQDEVRHCRSREFIDYSSEDSNSDGSSDLFVPKTRSQYDLTKSHTHGNRKATTRTSLRAKSHNNVWPRLDHLSASDGEDQSVAKSSLVLLHSTDDFITAVDASRGDDHRDTDRKSSHRRHGSKAARQEQIRKFKSAENVVSARHTKRSSVLRSSEGNDGRRMTCDHRDMDLRGDVSFDGKFVNVIDSAV